MFRIMKPDDMFHESAATDRDTATEELLETSVFCVAHAVVL
jgi:hypothetical protein